MILATMKNLKMWKIQFMKEKKTTSLPSLKFSLKYLTSPLQIELTTDLVASVDVGTALHQLDTCSGVAKGCTQVKWSILSLFFFFFFLGP